MTMAGTGELSAVAASALAGHRQRVRRRVLVLAALAAAALAAFALDLVTGPSALAPAQVLHGLMFPDELARTARVIVFEVRLPQAVMALLVGAALALAGAEMQTVLNNPMASPFTLGMSAAATFGAALAIVLGLGLPGVPATWTVPLNAFVCALGSALLLQVLGRLRRSGDTLVLFGIALFFTFNALVALTQFVASEQALQQLVFWTMGSLSRATSEKVMILAGVLAMVAPFSLAAAWPLTALRLGPERAKSLGINVARLRLLSLVRLSLLTGAAVAYVGVIAFVGLVGPHIARLLIGEDHRFFLPASALAGAVLMSLASCASKTAVSGIVLPIGLITSLIGVPIFLTLVLTRRGG
ncbi:FecCD family ABC transporter permease [Blastochloris viridis]|uniref:Iron(III) dicitrate transport system permease protein FecD n=1 Tax=Blastochloris viridis TaxID=1079 RepID=A0A0H5BAC0_BLAVI|nr:iron ABC transporter permease [Blastochloris viridis]ALK10892.1 Hemin transport system permease protein HmuU [Blastochloris viridis]BAR99130.1 iron(III) dicitrate transport system permease protein FecD [Blastochloris viridis]CUU43554.1 putative ABC transporter permease protein [Blastochloris viridis]